MKKALIASLIIAGAMTGCTSLGNMPGQGIDTVRGQYQHIAPDTGFDPDQDHRDTVYTLSVPFYKW